MKPWLRFLAARLLGALVVSWAVVSTVFVLAYLLPADPARAALGPHAGPEALSRVRAAMCLDKPFLTQYGCHVGRIFRLDFGTSFSSGRPVADILLERLGPTAELALAALLLVLVIAVPVALRGARSRSRRFEEASALAAFALQAIPPFVLGPVLAIVFSYRLHLLPSSGVGAPSDLLDQLRHLLLPALTLAAGGVAAYSRLLSTELGRVAALPHVRVARAKGASETLALRRHALPLAMGPVIAMAGVDLGALLGGAAVTEYVFGWPGLGREAVLGVLELDLPVVLGVVLFSAFAVVLANLVADITHALIDPRLRPR